MTSTGSTDCTFVASGRTITFSGFLKAYVESVEDADGQSDDAQTRLPNLAAGQSLRPGVGHRVRSRDPPAGSLHRAVAGRQAGGAGDRPAVDVRVDHPHHHQSRDYVFKKGSALVPTWLAFAVTRLLEEHFPKLVDYAFTAEMEEMLDQIAGGNAARLQVLTDFYFGSTANGSSVRSTGSVCTGWCRSSARSTRASSPPSRSVISKTPVDGLRDRGAGRPLRHLRRGRGQSPGQRRR